MTQKHIAVVSNYVAFHHSVNGQKLVRTRVMGHSEPNFSLELEPIIRTRLNVDSKHVRRYVAPLAFNKKKKHIYCRGNKIHLDHTFVSTNHFSIELYQYQLLL